MPNSRSKKDDETYLRLICYLAGVFNSFVFDFLIRSRVTMTLNFFYVYQTPVPADFNGRLAERITTISARLNAIDARYQELRAFAKRQSEEISPKSRLAQFKQRYKAWPKIGMKVDVVTDDDGYWKIALRHYDCY